MNGAGGQGHLDVLVASGGNTIRRWGIEDLSKKIDGRPLVEAARRHGLLISAGIWVGRQRHGFDYGDPAQSKRQREEIRTAVARWKSEPSIGLWGLGDEMEGSGSNVRIWKELEVLAGIIREVDPDRPIMTVIAGAGLDKVKAVKSHCPGIDILGVNAYAPAAGVGRRWKPAGEQHSLIK